jgi:typhasterol/6-deoxotyphasterol 2alpha-hydroxylase
MRKLGRMFDAFMEYLIDEHAEWRRREGEGFVARDMVDVLMQLAEDPMIEVQLGGIDVKVFTQDLIAGGTESSSVTVEWAMSELLEKPSVFASVVEELDRVIRRGRWVKGAGRQDLAHLPC